MDAGSDTEEEEMDVPDEAAAESKGNSKSPNKSDAVLYGQSDEEDYASDSSSDILQPTQVSSSGIVVAVVVVGGSVGRALTRAQVRILSGTQEK